MNSQRRTGLWLVAAGTVMAIAAISAVIAVIGTPAQRHLSRLDDRRVDDLGALSKAIGTHARATGSLPTDLAALARARSRVRLNTTDPADGRPYEYRVLSPDRYQLCARFATDLDQIPSEAWYDAHEWRHAAGRVCFELDVDEPPGATSARPRG